MISNASRLRSVLASRLHLDTICIDLYRLKPRRVSCRIRNFAGGLVIGMTVAASGVVVAEAKTDPEQHESSSSVASALAAIPPSSTPTRTTEPYKSQGTRSMLSNPGKYEDLGRECKETLIQDLFKGARFAIQKSIFAAGPKQLLLSGQVHMGSEHLPEQHIVEYTSQLAVDKHRFVASMDSTYRAAGRYTYALTPNLDFRGLFQSSLEKQHQYEAGLDFKTAESFTHATVTHVSEMMGSAQVLKVSHLHAIRPEWSVGAECLHYFDTKTLLTFVGRYRHLTELGTKGDIWTVTIPFDVQDGRYGCSYTRKVSERLSLATEGNYHHPKRESSAVVGMLYQGTTFRFQANVDSEYRVSATLEQAVSAVLRFLFSGDINHASHESNFGFGLAVGS